MKFIRRSPLTLLLIAYLILGSLYSIVTPIFEASDELWHYPMVKALADNGLQLPVQNPAVPTDWRQEGSQPPLYYMLSAVLTSWIDTSDLDKVRYLNPHPDIGVVVPDGNANMIIHNPALEAFPWHGTVLAVHLVRFFSVLLGAITVAATYLLTLELFPERRWLAFVAGAFTAFNPMFLFISGSVNNDNLSNALGCLLLLLIVRLVKRRDAPPIRDLVIIGIVTGAGMLAKFNIGFMVILVALSLAIISYRLRNWRPLIVGGLITGGLTILIAGWWYLRNQQLYGDPTGLNMMLSIVGPRNIPANLPQLWSERTTFLMSYWGFFGGVNVPMPDWVYTVFNAIAALAVVGLVVGAVRGLIRTSPPAPLSVYREGELVDSPRPEGEGLGRAFTIIWIVVLFVSLLRWTSVTWASQGRLMFSAIAPISMWMAVGLWTLGQRGLRQLPIQIAIGWFLIGSYFGFAIIFGAFDKSIESYDQSPYLMRSDAVAFTGPSFAFAEPEQTHGAIQIGLNNFVATSVQVGNYLAVDEDFQLSREPVTRDWSIFLHVENEDGVIIAQRDVYPGEGAWATSILAHELPLMFSNIAWHNNVAVYIPDFTIAPQKVRIYLGFYDHKTGERMNAYAIDNFGVDEPVKGSPITEIYLGTVTILPRTSSLNVPNPMSVNFGDQVELVGYDISSLDMYPKKKITVTFYWRALHPLSTDYHVFTQILEPDTTHVFAGSDKQQLSTGWKPGDIIKDEHTMIVHDDAPPGTWQLQVGMYQSTPNNQFQRLRIITPDGGQADDAAQLTRVKIDPPLEPF